MKLSVSQYKQYERCPYSWYLSRVEKAWQRPAAWLPQGSAVHEAGEAWERSGRTMTLEEMQQVYTESYDNHVNTYCDVTPNLEWWFWSGPYNGEADINRRYKIGKDQCGKMLDWYGKHPEEVVWIAPDGTPGIELGFDIDLDGIEIRGFIDLVIETEKGLYAELDVRDNKTGNKPGDDFQLGVYAVAIEEKYGIAVNSGTYWMGRTGKPTKPYDLTDWTRETVRDKFVELQDNINAGNFPPDPEPSKCRFCDVSYSCQYSQA
ncbi:Inactivated superfamily I helicase [Mycobacteroides abscessus subsp. massiliense]|uniref:RecB family exonuclease n=1 Tax=Mycobacteroides abscessus TaxID=36809 RepID=UPI0009A8C1B3|nr:PD-(D/E)XK nuclease family protein [Mycobacteroides abscessus]SKD59923.1 Inactivated superfamily I helicase [Mycobacteroides abscessus subsp. massiliense]SKH39601.1 Inactivated superfamily I helicase [Mycobacteroides abscessus subsp. massiliense]SKH90160.1 Inactivated superfamily I helicase [Mycobacteroides abscessus subsp. massiliense]SKK83653.1 Inactivated superfamily I helicase [Mycobacteroides abscessus subsp. massiliense]SKK90090.1 Inactivated superfamily I helicase [Mycobacteroides ab